jgi:hypothetical protein
VVDEPRMSRLKLRPISRPQWIDMIATRNTIMLNFTQDDLEAIAKKILDMHPDPVPRFRLLRDVLRLDPTDTAYRDAKKALQESKWTALLKRSQMADGTWGRFHTRDSRVKQPFPTTESAIATALDLGLDGHSPTLQRVLPVILEYVDGTTLWPDPPEKHDNPQAWFVWVRHFSAAILALIEQHHPQLDAFWALWAEALHDAFQSGVYDRQREIAALNVLLDCRMKNPVPFHVRYPLLILSATHHQLSDDLERKMLDYVMHAPSGIYYVYAKNISILPPILSRDFWGWFRAHQLLSRFRVWKALSTEAVNWIWAQRTDEEFWDVGGHIARKPSTSFPLSESWRRPESRIIDSTVEMLGLLSKAC